MNQRPEPSSAPSITVVTPSFNQGGYIGECIESVAREQYPAIEHLIIDNCSQDSTLEVLEGLQHYPHLKVISEPDNGQSHAINKGVGLARGEWCLWLNADDALEPGALAAFAEAVRKRPGVDMVYGHVHFVDERGRWVRTVYHIPYDYRLTFFKVYMPPSTGSLFRTSLLRSTPLDELFHLTMDTEWFLRCGRGLTTYRVDAPLSRFRVSGTNKTAQHVLTGEVSPRHRREQLEYTQRWILSQVPGKSIGAKHLVYQLGRQFARVRYYVKKLQYADKYLAQRARRVRDVP